jgi:hypothetical protein
MVWEDGLVVDLQILSKLGNTLNLRFGTSEAQLATVAGQVIGLMDVMRVI